MTLCIKGVIILEKSQIKRILIGLSYLLAILVFLMYFIAERYNGSQAELLELESNVFAPCTAFIVIVYEKVSNKKTRINNYSFYKFPELKRELAKSKIENITSVNIDINKKINVRISSKEVDSGSIFIKIANLIVIILTILVILLSKEITALGLLLGLTSTSVILNNLIMALEDRKTILFDYAKLENKAESIEKTVNYIYQSHMTDYIKFNSIKEFDGSLYFVLGYSKPGRIVRCLYDVYVCAICIIVIRLMCINGMVYMSSLFPVILGYINFMFGEEGSKLSRRIDTKTIEIVSHLKEYGPTEDFDEIETIMNGDMKVDVLYRRMGKIPAMIGYFKLNK